MEHRGKQFRVILDIDLPLEVVRRSHRRLYEIRHSTEPRGRPERAIDKALARKKKHLDRPQ